jgi:hypothetical protein
VLVMHVRHEGAECVSLTFVRRRFVLLFVARTEPAEVRGSKTEASAEAGREYTRAHDAPDMSAPEAPPHSRSRRSLGSGPSPGRLFSDTAVCQIRQTHVVRSRGVSPRPAGAFVQLQTAVTG